MARKKVVRTAEEAGELADELIAEQAKERDDAQGDPPEDDGNLDESPDDGIDLSSLDEGGTESDEDDGKLEHKLNVLQGKYNKETERLSSMLSQAMAEISGLKAQFTQPSAPTPSGTPSANKDLEKLKAEYPSIYDGVLAAAHHGARQEVEGTSQKVDVMSSQIIQDRRSNYYRDLEGGLPQWEQINAHPAFAKWLNESDGISGTPRRAFLTEAFNGLDARKTLRFFNAFIQEKGIRMRDKNDSTSENIAPDTSGTNVRKTNNQTGSVTRAYIDKFYQDRMNGRYAGTEADAAKEEKRIFQAVKEGKVR